MNIGSCLPLIGKIETETLSVAIFQKGAEVIAENLDDVNKNIDSIIEWLNRLTVAMPGMDLVITPETSLQGSAFNTWKAAITLDGNEINRLKEVCKGLKLWLVVGAYVMVNDDEYVKNAAITINDQGEIANVYYKTNPWIPMEPVSPGHEIQVFNGPKGSRIATIICSDGDYTEPWREAAYKGANIIIRISAYMTPYENAYEITNRAGAFFNHCYVVSANECGIDDGYCWFGKSMAVNFDGDIIAQAPVGIPYLMKVDLYPGICDAVQKQSLMGDLNWQSNHRAAASPDGKGIGWNKDMYSFLKSDIKVKGVK